jgi:hypothetical protein
MSDTNVRLAHPEQLFIGRRLAGLERAIIMRSLADTLLRRSAITDMEGVSKGLSPISSSSQYSCRTVRRACRSSGRSA